ncbi:MAG: hypothetical protein WDO16_26075 [Bacteroidota bacterium]
MSFFSLDATGNSHTQLRDGDDPGAFNWQQLEATNYTTAAHEYGHVLGYFTGEKIYKDGSQRPDLNGFTTHSIKDEFNFIMNLVRDGQATLTGRRVDALEYTRINGGAGLHYSNHPDTHFIGNYYTKPPGLE